MNTRRTSLLNMDVAGMMLSAMGATRVWGALWALCVVSCAGILSLGPFWGAIHLLQEMNSLALCCLGLALTLHLLASSKRGRWLLTRSTLRIYAAFSGLSFIVSARLGLWTLGFPVSFSDFELELVGRAYWLGPMLVAYASLAWLIYQVALIKEEDQDD